MDTLDAGESLESGQALTSANGRYTLVMQTDGNLVLYRRDGVPVWESGTAGNPGAYLEVENLQFGYDTGAVTIYSLNGIVLWRQGT